MVDSPVDQAEVARRFGGDVASLVDGVTKLPDEMAAPADGGAEHRQRSAEAA